MPAVGDLVPTTDGRWKLVAPSHCPNGHQLGPNRSLVGHAPCGCGGHTTWRCLRCETLTYGLPLGDACTVLDGPAAVRNL